MKSKHTSGDWYETLEEWDDYVGHNIQTVDGRIIARTVTLDSVKETSEEKANARLLARAPRLKAALQAALWRLKCQHHHPDPVLEQAREALKNL